MKKRKQEKNKEYFVDEFTVPKNEENEELKIIEVGKRIFSSIGLILGFIYVFLLIFLIIYFQFGRILEIGIFIGILFGIITGVIIGYIQGKTSIKILIKNKEKFMNKIDPILFDLGYTLESNKSNSISYKYMFNRIAINFKGKQVTLIGTNPIIQKIIEVNNKKNM